MVSKEIILSEEQKNIVELSEGQHLVLAPPGTGKTELLAQRVDLALQRGIDPNKMICLTFTNRAAKVMKERIEEKHPNNGVFIGNIHNFSLYFLFKNKLIPLFTSILDEEDSDLLLKEVKTEFIRNDIIHNYITKINNGDLLRLNTMLKQQKLNFPEEIILKPEKSITNLYLAQKVCERYEAIKEESSLLDYDDLLTLTYFNLKNRNDYTKFSWIQVDEVQDLNPIQWEIIKLISENGAHKVFFGDYEQAIFSFMGAKLERLHNIEKECKVHNLQKNFRSPSYLLQIYIDYAKTHLNPKWKKDPIPEKTLSTPKDALIMANINGSNIDEANFIVKNILPQLLSQGKEQTAILVRYNSTAELFSNTLKENNIDHFKISGYDLFRRKLIKDIMAFLGCMQNEFDRVSWYRIFHIFGGIPTLKESRHFVNSLFEVGFIPIDLLKVNFESINVLVDFLSYYKNGRIVVFDTETTGLDTENDDIIQISAVEIIKGNIGKTFDIYVNTEKSLEKTEKIHHITKEFLSKYGINAKDALLKFNEFVNGDVLLSHNLKFDWNILRSNYLKNNILLFNSNASLKFDSIQIIRRIFPKLSSYALEDLIDLFKLKISSTHNALNDVKATVNLIQSIVPLLENKITLQKNFFEKNQKILEKFNKNLYPFWKVCYDNMEVKTTLPELILNFVNYLTKVINYKIEKEDNYHMSKLLRHMEINCGKGELRSLLNHVSAYRLYKESDLIIGDEKIIISTVHKAKGLEFDNVIIPECVTGVYPSWASKTEEEFKEDARTLYVALSRAMKRLIITTHSFFLDKKSSRTFSRNKSPFIECIEKYFNKIH